MDNLPIYFLILSAVYTCLLFFTTYRANYLEKDRKNALDISLILMLAGFIGGRAFHILFEEPQFYFEHPKMIFYFWQGGFVFFGGFFLSLISVFIFIRVKRLDFFEWADFFAPIIALGYSLGRWSCFFAGCCYGKACDLPWAVTFSWDQAHILRHPTQIYASLWEFLVFLALVACEKFKLFENRKGCLFSLWMILHGIGRIIMEYFRDDFRGEFIVGYSISSWICASLVIFGFASFNYFKKQKSI